MRVHIFDIPVMFPQLKQAPLTCRRSKHKQAMERNRAREAAQGGGSGGEGAEVFSVFEDRSIDNNARVLEEGEWYNVWEGVEGEGEGEWEEEKEKARLYNPLQVCSM